MKVSVWDTYVVRENGKVMHFDILVPDQVKEEEMVFKYGRQYLAAKPFTTGPLSTSECSFCHIAEASPSIVAAIENDGYSIIEMENCQ